MKSISFSTKITFHVAQGIVVSSFKSLEHLVSSFPRVLEYKNKASFATLYQTADPVALRSFDVSHAQFRFLIDIFYRFHTGTSPVEDRPELLRDGEYRNRRPKYRTKSTLDNLSSDIGSLEIRAFGSKNS